ncbi:hypothetical protein [Pyrococcus kukulkanii]|uniref:Uncharacterized protein n=1 Tax=Pyrococcus kukulkanii TaxID=1609559 RepID=A0ABV4T153_9EURY
MRRVEKIEKELEELKIELMRLEADRPPYADDVTDEDMIEAEKALEEIMTGKIKPLSVEELESLLEEEDEVFRILQVLSIDKFLAGNLIFKCRSP